MPTLPRCLGLETMPTLPTPPSSQPPSPVNSRVRATSPPPKSPGPPCTSGSDRCRRRPRRLMPTWLRRLCPPPRYADAALTALFAVLALLLQAADRLLRRRHRTDRDVALESGARRRAVFGPFCLPQTAFHTADGRRRQFPQNLEESRAEDNYPVPDYPDRPDRPVSACAGKKPTKSTTPIVISNFQGR